MFTRSLGKIVALSFGLLFATACGAANAPTKPIVEQVLKQYWDRTGPPKSVLTLNSVKFGRAYNATVKEVQVEGMPRGQVTPTIVDFTVRTYYDSETRADRRVREASVYKDKMGDWAIMTGSPKAEDVSTSEPARQ